MQLASRATLTARTSGFRRELESVTLRLLRPVEPPRATLRLVEHQGRRLVTKDFFDTPAWYRNTVGRGLIQREREAYRRLRGVPGIPQLLDSPRPDLLAMEYIPGVELSRLAPGELPPVALDQLRETLDGMHGAGVLHLDLGHDSHGDLGRETNMIWSAERGRLYVLDLAGALWRRLPRALFQGLAMHDDLALTKLDRRFFGREGPLDADDLPGWASRLFRALKKL